MPLMDHEQDEKLLSQTLMVFNVMVTGSCLASFIPNPRSVLLLRIGHFTSSPLSFAPNTGPGPWLLA